MRDSDAVAEEAPTHRRPVSTDEFKMALSRFASGVTVLTARDTSTGDPPEDVAMTATAFMSVSLDPPLVVVSVGRESRMFDLLARRDQWAVSVLAEEQVHVSSRFAIPGRVSDRLLFEDLPRHLGRVTGAVILDGALSAVECRTVNRIPAGDHTLMVGLVLA
ncbi:MAG TPA: flavin reductase family protein, partial [Mycobacteriales bacterium]|nr:flavin reductase family protein [Mycobacteriales bacterium]